MFRFPPPFLERCVSCVFVFFTRLEIMFRPQKRSRANYPVLVVYSEPFANQGSDICTQSKEKKNEKKSATTRSLRYIKDLRSLAFIAFITSDDGNKSQPRSKGWRGGRGSQGGGVVATGLYRRTGESKSDKRARLRSSEGWREAALSSAPRLRRAAIVDASTNGVG